MAMNFYTFAATVALVLLGAFCHVLKLVVEVREEKHNFTLRDYFGLYPYKTTLMVLTSFGGAVGLAAVGELSYATAFSVGYIGQSVGRAGKR